MKVTPLEKESVEPDNEATWNVGRVREVRNRTETICLFTSLLAPSLLDSEVFTANLEGYTTEPVQKKNNNNDIQN